MTASRPSRAGRNLPAAIAVGLLAAAVERAAKSATFMPRPGELRTYAEQARQSLAQSLKFAPCESCVGGWLSSGEVKLGNVTARRCVCYRAYQQKLADLGVGSQPVSLPAGRDEWMDA